MSPSRSQKKKPRPKPRKPATARALPRDRVPAAVKAMAAPFGPARFAAGKALAATAAKDPSRVYPHFDAIAALLHGDSKIVRWNALQIIALLSPADGDHKVDAVLETYLGFIHGGNLISAANAIGGARRIGCVRPDLLDRIIPAILGVEKATYETPECRNVAIQQALAAFLELGLEVCHQPLVAKFILRQRTNPRPAAAKKAAFIIAQMGLVE